MPKRTDIKTILVIRSGPIVIGQGCEFDYSGTQACRTLKAEGYRVVLVNSNPATSSDLPSSSEGLAVLADKILVLIDGSKATKEQPDRCATPAGVVVLPRPASAMP